MNDQISNIRLSFKCPADYSSMTDTAGGKFCTHCQKTVHDFTNTKADVFRQILAENGNNVCGRFTAQQMALENVSRPMWKKWVSAAMVLVGINLWGKEVVAQVKNKPNTSKNTTTITAPPVIGELAVSKNAKCDSPLIYVGMIMETQPEFPGGAEAWKAFLKTHLKAIKGVKGRVVAVFTVEKDGRLTNISIAKGLNEQADNEVLRVLKLSPNWEPGRISDQPTPVQFTVPVKFL